MTECQTATAGKFVVPKYETKHFNTTEEFNEYIQSPDYKKDSDHKGVCLGFQ